MRSQPVTPLPELAPIWAIMGARLWRSAIGFQAYRDKLDREH